MVEIGGIVFKQPSDMEVVAYSGTKHVLIASGNTIQKVLMSAYAEGTHNHSNENLYPAQIVKYAGATYLYINAGAWIAMRMDVDAHVEFIPKAGQYFDVLGATRIKRDASISYALEITGTAGTRNARADAWDIWACSLQDKQNIQEIDNPESRLKNVRGLTYEREGQVETGFVVEDIEKALLPGSVYTKDGKIESYNPLSILALAVQSINAQATVIADLQKRVEELEQ